MIRTPREWDEMCRECCGAGKVHKRERFTLLTPEEYAEMMGPDHALPRLSAKLAAVAPINAVVCWAGLGTIHDACREGVALSRAYGRPVVFEFNDAVAVCHGDTDPDEEVRRWWVRAYGQTYEQSMRDR